MAATVTIHYGNKRYVQTAQPKKRQQPVQAQAPQQAEPKTAPIAIKQQATQAPACVPAQDQYRTIVRPRFIGDSFVYVPVKVPTVNPDGSPIKSPGEAFMDWLFGR